MFHTSHIMYIYLLKRKAFMPINLEKFDINVKYGILCLGYCLCRHNEHFFFFFFLNMHCSKRSNSIVFFRADIKSVVEFFISVSCLEIFQNFLKFLCYSALKYIFVIQNTLILKENVMPKNFWSYTFFY